MYVYIYLLLQVPFELNTRQFMNSSRHGTAPYGVLK